MKSTLFKLLTLTTALLLVGCSSTANSSKSSEQTYSSEESSKEEELSSLNSFSIDYEEMKTTYGDFSITQDSNVLAPDEDVYYINVASSKLTYVISGYFEGRIVIQNGNNLSDYKGVTLEFNNAFIVNDDEATIDYQVDAKNVEIITDKSTTNYIVNTSETNYDGHAVNSNNSIKLQLKADSNLYLYTVHGHTMKSDGDVKLIGSGNFTISNAISQGVKCSLNSGTGTLNITGGTFVINNCESVFKVDSLINISAGSLTATGIWSYPFARDIGDTLILTVADGVSAVVNGENYTSQTF